MIMSRFVVCGSVPISHASLFLYPPLNTQCHHNFVTVDQSNFSGYLAGGSAASGSSAAGPRMCLMKSDHLISLHSPTYFDRLWCAKHMSLAGSH